MVILIKSFSCHFVIFTIFIPIATVVTSPSSGINPHPYDIGTNSLGRPLYPRTQYNIHRNPGIHDSHQSGM